MKVPKLVHFDVDVLKKLKKIKNCSRLINDTMADYFFIGNNQKVDEIKANIAGVKKKIFDDKVKLTELENSLNKIEKKEEELKSIFKDIPSTILRDFKDFPKMTEEILVNRYKNIYKTKISYDRILKAFRQYKKC